MWKKVISRAVQLQQHHQPWRLIANPFSTNSNVSSAVNSMLLRSLKEHYLEVSKMSPPPKVSPPSPFTIIKGALDGNGPVLTRSYGDEEINISVMRLANIIPGGDGDGDGDEDDGINQLFLHVNISKPGQSDCLHFLCGLYPDALGIHSVSMLPKVDSGSLIPSTYNGPTFDVRLVGCIEVGSLLRLVSTACAKDASAFLTWINALHVRGREVVYGSQCVF